MELRRGTPWILYAATWLSVGAAGLAIWAAAALEQARNPPPCHGIGWGCSLEPAESAGLALVVLGVPYLVALASLLGLLELAGPKGTRMRAVVAGLGAALPLVVVVLIAVPW